MWTPEQGDYEDAMNKMKYPKPKCKAAYCNNDNKAFNDGFCLSHTPTKEERSKCCGAPKYEEGGDLTTSGVCSKCGKPFIPTTDTGEEKFEKEWPNTAKSIHKMWFSPSPNESEGWSERFDKIWSTSDLKDLKENLHNLVYQEISRGKEAEYEKTLADERRKQIREMYETASVNVESYSGEKKVGNEFVKDFLQDYAQILGISLPIKDSK